MRQNLCMVCEAVFFHLPVLKHDCSFLDSGEKSGTTQPLCATHLAAKEASFHPSWQISNKARWQAMAQCRWGSTSGTLLGVTDVHESCTSIRP